MDERGYPWHGEPTKQSPSGQTAFWAALSQAMLGHCFVILRIWSRFSPNACGTISMRRPLCLNYEQSTRKHFFVHILQKSREPASEALHSKCIQITPPGSSVNDRKTQRSRNCLQMASEITFIFI